MARLLPDAGGPRRTCVGCGQVTAPADLVRVVRIDEETLVVGRTLAGRGAWLCRDTPSCLDEAIRRGGFARSFRAPVTRAAVERLRAPVAAERPLFSSASFVPDPPAARDSTTVPGAPGIDT